MSVNFTMHDNPFRAGGELSKDADDIIDAFKCGKLSVISIREAEILEKDTKKEEIIENIAKYEVDSLETPMVRKNEVLEVSVPEIKMKDGQEVFEDRKREKAGCCVVL